MLVEICSNKLSSKKQNLAYSDRILHLACKNLDLLFLSFSAPYVKVYLLENGVCIAKKKTKVARKTLEPLYQQLLSFEESPQGKVLQVICITVLNLRTSLVQFSLRNLQKSFTLHLTSFTISKPCWVQKY